MLEYFYQFDLNLRLRNMLLREQKKAQSKDLKRELQYTHRRLVLIATLIKLLMPLETYASIVNISFLKLDDRLKGHKNITEFEYIEINRIAKSRCRILQREFIGDANEVYKKYFNNYLKITGMK